MWRGSFQPETPLGFEGRITTFPLLCTRYYQQATVRMQEGVCEQDKNIYAMVPRERRHAACENDQ